jgi:hypothetical protein
LGRGGWARKGAGTGIGSALQLGEQAQHPTFQGQTVVASNGLANADQWGCALLNPNSQGEAQVLFHFSRERFAHRHQQGSIAFVQWVEALTLGQIARYQLQHIVPRPRELTHAGCRGSVHFRQHFGQP